MKWIILLGAGFLAGLQMLLASEARAGDPISVCVASGGALRLLAKSETCKPGEQKKIFAEWEPEKIEPPDEEGQELVALRKQVDALSNRLVAIEQGKPLEQIDTMSKRLVALEQNTQTEKNNRAVNRVVAPFEVVGRGGAVILRVAEKVPSESGAGARVTIGGGDAGNYAVRVHGKGGGQMVAGIGQARDGSGVAVVMDDSGDVAAGMEGASRRVYVSFGDTLKAAMIAEYKGGVVGVYEGANAVAYLTKSTSGDGGNVTLGLNNGFGVFSAGAAGDGGGEACVNRVTGGGQQRRACVGVELPSMGLGK